MTHEVPAIDRRVACGALLAGLAGCAASPNRTSTSTATTTTTTTTTTRAATRPTARVLATWDHGLPANRVALPLLASGASALDAVEAGCRVVEADCPDMTVGLGSRPDRDGFVTLDAAVMTGDGRAGSVAFVQGVAHPVSLARLVLERTPHVMLVGRGAEDFARASGVVVHPPLLTPAAEREWRAWLVERRYEPRINVENHDTISMLALDRHGAIAAASTTSGLAYKMHGRIGDSPVIGAGLFVEAPIGGAVCTGLGETVLRTLGAFVAVEGMRAGLSPQEACEAAIRRIVARNGDPSGFQVGMLALDMSGEVGAASVQPGFTFAIDEELREARALFG